MSKIIGTERKFFKNAVIAEKDIPSIVMRIKNLGKMEGKDLYGFFVTKDEFLDRLSSIYCCDGWYDIPIVTYEEGESNSSCKKNIERTFTGIVIITGIQESIGGRIYQTK